MREEQKKSVQYIDMFLQPTQRKKATTQIVTDAKMTKNDDSTYLLLNLGKDSSRSLHLELVDSVGLLVDGGPGLSGGSLTVSRGGDENVNTVNLSLLEGLDLLLRSVLADAGN